MISPFLLLWSIYLLSFAPSSFQLINTYPIKANTISVDNLGNFYTVSDNQVLKFGTDGKLLFHYDELHYGKIGMIDVTNPMKVLVFFPDFLTVITLDRTLSPITVYDFFKLGYQNITAVASSIDGLLWFYDNNDFKLKKIDQSGKIFRASQPLNIILGEVPNPNFIIERDNQVYVNDPNIGILVFDYFGSYAKTIPLKGLQKFQIVQKQIVYREDGLLKSYNPLTFETNEITLPDTAQVIGAALESKSLGVLKNDRVDFYTY